MRTLRTIHSAIDAPIDDLITFRAMPTRSIDHIDPFLFLNHHGPQEYPQNNNGLPFGPHPHRGFETLTFIFEGDLMHWDSGGGKSVIREGGIQWMTAGKGLVHPEVSSDEFKKNGGRVELIQLWLNLPARYKMVDPQYTGLQQDEIPSVYLDNGNIELHLISGEMEGIQGPVNSLSNIWIGDMKMRKGAKFEHFIDAAHNVLLYVVKGEIKVGDTSMKKHQLAEFDNDHEKISFTATEDSLVLFGHAMPFHEPIVAQGPFVMNDLSEIRQAYADYQQGKMGSLS